MKSTFEEKTYENYFNIELNNRSKIFLPIGQVQEGALGFDATAFSRNYKLWRMLGLPYFFDGSELEDIAHEMEQFLGTVINNIPKMKVNLLFQYKKPEYMKLATAKDWDKWKEPFYRYDIYQEQQQLLMNIHNNFGSQVLVIYAAPALHDINDLVKAYINKKILDYSNFKKAADLNLHHRNTYIQGGTFSIACSEEKKIVDLDLIELLEKSSKEATVDNEESNRDFIINFRKQIVELTSKNEYYGKSLQKLNEVFLKFQKYELLYSFLVLSNFKQLTGIQWIVKL